MKPFFNFFIFITGLLFSPLAAEYDYFDDSIECVECEDAYKGIRGKLDFAPAFVHIDLLKSGHTIHKLDLPGVKADCYYRIWQGLVIKPEILYAHGHGSDEVISGGVGIGFCIPCKDCGCITPVVGCNWGNMKTHTTINPQPEFFLHHVSNKFRSISPYIGIEGSYTFIKGWRIVATYRYSWSRTHTSLKKDAQNPFTPAIDITF